MTETLEMKINKNTEIVFDFYVDKILSLVKIKNKNVILIGLGNTKFIKLIKSVAKNVCIIDHCLPFERDYKLTDEYQLEIDIKKYLEKNNMPKFDVAIMNPPYGGICKKIYELIYKNKFIKSLVSINPAEYWEFIPYLKNTNPAFFNNLKTIDIIDHKEFCEIFDIGNAVTGNGCIVKFDYTSDNTKNQIKKFVNMFADNNTLSILNKFIANTPGSIVANKGVEQNKTQKAWEANYKRYKKYGNYTKIYTWHLADNPTDMIICPEDGNGKSIIGFKTKKELDNFISSLTCWPYYFAKYITTTDNAKMLSYCPFMQDYTQPWDDKRFCKYFGITGYISDTEAEPNSEWETILNTMKEYV